MNMFPLLIIISGLLVLALAAFFIKGGRAKVRSKKTLVEKEDLDRIIESIAEGVAVCDKDGKLTHFNSTAKSILGSDGDMRNPDQWSDSFGIFCVDKKTHFPIDDYPLVRALKGESTRDVEMYVKNEANPDGIYIRVNGRPIFSETEAILGGVATFLDVSNEKKYKDRLAQSEKLEAIGQLAGGIAHDLNNKLATMTLALSETKRKLAEKADAGEELGLLEQVAGRAGQLTQQILAFSRKQVLNPKDIHLNELVKENLLFLKRVLGKNIEISTRLESRDDLVFIDSIQVTQILMNLAINAREAMPNGGRLTIETQNISFVTDEEKLSIEIKAGAYVSLIVSDTGTGMPKEILSKIFEPFFTTKQMGTGLGLSTVHGIVQQSKGHIWVYSEKNKGTTFKIYLPAVLNGVPLEKMEPTLKKIIDHRRKSVLVVEDDVEIRKLVHQLLERENYIVLVAGSGEEGEQVAANAPVLDLLLTDTLLPSMSSREMATRLLLRFPDLKIIYMSGFPKNVIAHHGVLDPGVLFIAKPFPPKQLLELIVKTLAE